MEKRTSEQGFATNRAGPSLTEARKRLNQDDEDIPFRFSAMWPTEEKKPAMTPKHWEDLRPQTAPSWLPSSTSRIFIANYGSGNVSFSDVGNIKDSDISNMDDNNSKNYFQRGPKPTYSTEEKKPDMAPKHWENVRPQTAPSRLRSSTSRVFIANYGSGNVDNNDVGNIKDSIISNTDDKNYFQRGLKPTYRRRKRNPL